MRSKSPFRCPWALAVLVTGAVLVLPLGAKPGNGKGKGPGKKEKVETGGKKTPPGQAGKDHGPGKGFDHDPGPAHKHYSDRDRDIIVSFFGGYRNQASGLPPGLAKKVWRGKPLPPGWQKKLQPGWVITDDWWDHFTPVSYDYFPGLTRYPDTGLYLHQNRLVRVYEPRRSVIEVIVIPSINF